jgi:hypothetical protein
VAEVAFLIKCNLLTTDRVSNYFTFSPQRLNRERVARRALEIARTTLTAKAVAAAAADPSANKSSGLSDMMNRFSSSTRGAS